MPSQEESTLFPAASFLTGPNVSLEQLARLGWSPCGISGTPVGVEFCSLLDPFTTFHPLPQPVTSSDAKGTCLSNDDVVRLDLQGLHSGTEASNGRIYFQIVSA